MDKETNESLVALWKDMSMNSLYSDILWSIATHKAYKEMMEKVDYAEEESE